MHSASLKVHSLLAVAALFTLPALVACSDDGYTPVVLRTTRLAELDGVGAEVKITQTRFSLELDVGVRYAGQPYESFGGFEGRGVTYCPAMDDSFSIKLDGVALPLVSRGDWELDGLSEVFPCLHPRVTTLIDAARQRPDSTLVISDSSKTITVALGDQLMSRRAELGADPIWNLTRDQAFSVRFQPASALDKLTTLRFEAFADQTVPDLVYQGGGTNISWPDSTANFLIPSTAPAMSGRLRFEIKPPQTLCGQDCRVLSSYSFDQGVTVR